MALSKDQLEKSTLLVKPYARLEDGGLIELPEIKVVYSRRASFILYQTQYYWCFVPAN